MMRKLRFQAEPFEACTELKGHETPGETKPISNLKLPMPT